MSITTVSHPQTLLIRIIKLKSPTANNSHLNGLKVFSYDIVLSFVSDIEWLECWWYTLLFVWWLLDDCCCVWQSTYLCWVETGASWSSIALFSAMIVPTFWIWSTGEVEEVFIVEDLGLWIGPISSTGSVVSCSEVSDVGTKTIGGML